MVHLLLSSQRNRRLRPRQHIFVTSSFVSLLPEKETVEQSSDWSWKYRHHMDERTLTETLVVKLFVTQRQLFLSSETDKAAKANEQDRLL